MATPCATPTHALFAAAAAVTTTAAAPALAQWTPPYRAAERIGLYEGPEFTAPDGAQDSVPQRLNQSGRIIGRSQRCTADGAHFGDATWVWDASAGAIRTGFFSGSEFTRDDGYQHSRNIGLLESGRIVGVSERFSGAFEAGAAAWTWTAETGTVRIGLYDAVHTSDVGVIANSVFTYNQSGVILGTTDRSGGGPQGSLGRSAWVFDPATNVTTELVFSVAGDGRANTVPTFLTESGCVLGLYDLYADDSLLSVNIFLWSIDRGFTDLGDLIDGGLSAAGIDRLTAVLGINEASYILARGLPLSAPATAQALYAFTIPSAPAATLIPLTLLATARRRRR